MLQKKLRRFIALASTQGFIDIFLFLFSGLTLLCWLSFLTGMSFRFFCYLGFSLSLIVTVGACWAKISASNFPTSRNVQALCSSRTNLRYPLYAAAMAFITVFTQDSRAFFLCLLASSSLIFYDLWSGRPLLKFGAKRPVVAKIPVAAYGLACLTAAIVLLAHRPDGDDEFFLSHSIFVLRSPDTPLNELPPEFSRSARALGSHQLIISAISWIGRMPLLDVYYIYFPALAGFVSCLAIYSLSSRLSGANALLVTLVTLIVALAWGDTHRAPGNFFAVRLFQGKGLCASVFMPLMLLYAIDYRRHGHPSSMWKFSLAATSAIGASQTALLLVPLFCISAVGFLLPKTAQVVASTHGSDGRFDKIQAVLGDALRLCPFAAMFCLATAVVLYTGQTAQRGDLKVDSGGMIGISAVEFTIGTSMRGAVGFAALFALPYLIARDVAAPMKVFVAFGLLVAFNPLTGALLEHLNPAATWRVVWIFPFAIAVSIVFVESCSLAARGNTPVFAAGLVTLLASHVLLGATSLDSGNGVRFGVPGHKIPDRSKFKLREFGNKDYPIHRSRICVDARCY